MWGCIAIIAAVGFIGIVVWVFVAEVLRAD